MQIELIGRNRDARTLPQERKQIANRDIFYFSTAVTDNMIVRYNILIVVGTLSMNVDPLNHILFRQCIQIIIHRGQHNGWQPLFDKTVDFLRR